MLVGGGLVVAAATLAHRALGDAMPTWLHGGALGLGGLAVVFGSCDAMIRSRVSEESKSVPSGKVPR